MASESPTSGLLLPTLPTEMVEEVVDQASDDPASLRQLSLLCKSLLTRARIHLFKSIVIRDVEQMDSSREFLNSHPWAPPLVQKVILSISIPFKYSKPNIPLLDIFRLHLFTRLPNLRGWKMNIESNSSWNRNPPRLSLHSSTALCYRIYGGRVQNLELVNIYFRDMSHFIRLVSAFTSLCSLTCSEIRILSLHTGNSENPNRPVKPMKIQQLSIGRLVDIRCIKYLLTSNATTLENLDLEFSNLGSDTVFNRAYNIRLKESMERLSKPSSLRLTTSLAGSSTRTPPLNLLWEEEQIQWATRILQHLRTLRTRLDAQMQLESDIAALIRNRYSGGLGSGFLEPCTVLDKEPPVVNVQFCSPEPDQRRVGRAKSWSPTVPVIASPFQW